MKVSPKVLVVSAIAAGLAFFLFSRSSGAETVDESAAASAGSGGSLAGLVSAGIKKALGAVSKILFPAAAGAAAAGAVATASIGSVTLVGSNIALPAAMPGAAASGAGAATGLGPALATVGLLASPFILGPPLQKLLTKTHAEWEAQILEDTKADLAFKAASMEMAEGFALSQKQLSEIPVLTGLSELEQKTEGFI